MLHFPQQIKNVMSASTKLSTSVKALCYLAEKYPDPKTSKEIAKSIDVNASKLRQLLSLLSKNEIIDSRQGINGGFQLKKDPNKIHLQKIYCAVEERKAFHLDVSNLHKRPTDKSTIFNNYFLNLFSDVQIDIENKMRKITLSSIMKQLEIESINQPNIKTKKVKKR